MCTRTRTQNISWYHFHSENLLFSLTKNKIYIRIATISAENQELLTIFKTVWRKMLFVFWIQNQNTVCKFKLWTSADMKLFLSLCVQMKSIINETWKTTRVSKWINKQQKKNHGKKEEEREHRAEIVYMELYLRAFHTIFWTHIELLITISLCWIFHGILHLNISVSV